MKAIEFLCESPADEITADLRQIGLTDQRRDSGNTISVYVPPSSRLDVMAQMEEQLPGAVWDKSYSNSSVGAIRYKGGTIRVRPKGKAGINSAGLGNEQAFINGINNAIAMAGEPINISFTGQNGIIWKVDGCKAARGVGNDTAGRKKADVILETESGNKHISIKKGNAEYWESADTYFGHEADKIIDKMIASGNLELIPLGKQNSTGKEFIKLSREIAAKATAKEVVDIVFGSDLQGPDGAIIKATFSPNDFNVVGNVLKLNCKVVIVDIADIPITMEVYFLIRNDSSRGRPKYKYPGVRATAIYQSRINGPTLISSR